MGFIVLGIFAITRQSLQGSVLQMVNHGISTGALFLLVGFIYERRHTREISELKGLQKPAPILAAVFTVVMLSSIGLPGTNGFVGEFLVLLGAFRTQTTWAIFATTGVILSACYMLWMFQRVIFGPVDNVANESLRDLSAREKWVFAPLLVFVFWLGFFPNPVLDRIRPSIDQSLTLIRTRELQSREFEARQAMIQQGVAPCCPDKPGVPRSPQALQGGVR
jgi:NADH-quinone oxidoreductase subunit M